MKTFKTILAIETSCDETSAAVLSNKNSQITVLSNIVASSAELQAKYGGVIPEQAAREQLKSIIPVVDEALQRAKLKRGQFDAIAVTFGPGLIGPLLIGVETAKTLSLSWNLPLIPVNHLTGHLFANWIKDTDSHTQPEFPCVGLLTSGGHTDLVYFRDFNRYDYLGGTRDDAAGECFDKCARLLNLPYPGGPELSKLATSGNPEVFDLPHPMLHSGDLDFSFSGLKTAVSNLIAKKQIKKSQLPDLAASIQNAIVHVLVQKTLKACKQQKCSNVILAGGVAANMHLRSNLESALKSGFSNYTLHIPPPVLCTDNAAMIGAAAFFSQPINNPEDLQANPNLTL